MLAKEPSVCPSERATARPTNRPATLRLIVPPIVRPAARPTVRSPPAHPAVRRAHLCVCACKCVAASLRRCSHVCLLARSSAHGGPHAHRYASSCVLPTAWTALPLVGIQPSNHDTTIFEFGLPAGQSLSLPTCACLLMLAPRADPFHRNLGSTPTAERRLLSQSERTQRCGASTFAHATPRCPRRSQSSMFRKSIRTQPGPRARWRRCSATVYASVR